jgi:hypothetical protein
MDTVNVPSALCDMFQQDNEYLMALPIVNRRHRRYNGDPFY